MALKFNPLTGKLDEYGPILTGTGTVAAAGDGTAALPGIAFANDLNTGIYRPGADQVAISTGGTGRLFIDSLGRLLVGTTVVPNLSTTVTPRFPKSVIFNTALNDERQSLGLYTGSTGTVGPILAFTKNKAASTTSTLVASGDETGSVVFSACDGSGVISAASITGFVDGSPGANDMPGRIVLSTTPDNAAAPVERLRLDSGGVIYIGSYTPSQIGATFARVQVAESISINGVNTFGAAGITASLLFHHRTTANTNGQIAGKIESVSTNTYTNGVPSTFDADIVTYSAENGANVEVVRATSDKYLRLASGTGGIQFNGDTAAANALDDYEEGTWTPVVADAATGGNTAASYTQQYGYYCKIGNRVFVAWRLEGIATTGMTGANVLFIRALPFTIGNPSPSGQVFSGAAACTNTAFDNSLSAFINPATAATAFRISTSTSAGVARNLSVSDVTSGSANIFGQFFYFV